MGGLLAMALLALAATGAMPAHSQPGSRQARVGVIFNALPMSQLQPPPPTATAALAIQDEIIKAGWRPGRNVEMLWRSAEGDHSRFPAIIDELLRHKVDVLVVGHNELAIEARKRAPALPIVMTYGGNLVQAGLVERLSRPGGHVTGVEVIPGQDLLMKQLEVMLELVPGLRRIALLEVVSKPGKEWGSVLNPPGKRRPVWDSPSLREVVLLAYGIEGVDQIEQALAHAARMKAQAVIVGGCAACYQAPVQARINAAVESHRLPAMNASWLSAVENGTLVGYGIEPDLNFRRAGYYVGRILNGEKAAELPVERLDTFRLHVNRTAARTIGITIPQSVLVRADKVFD
jgi:putative tryptophan/tyrosine transport system substrate-binding protein